MTPLTGWGVPSYPLRGTLYASASSRTHELPTSPPASRRSSARQAVRLPVRSGVACSATSTSARDLAQAHVTGTGFVEVQPVLFPVGAGSEIHRTSRRPRLHGTEWASRPSRGRAPPTRLTVSSFAEAKRQRKEEDRPRCTLEFVPPEPPERCLSRLDLPRSVM